MIPAKAVEAAAKEIDAPSEPAAQEIARRALEAAAPHMGLRSAWHDAVSEAYVEGALSADQANIMWAKNPFRKEPK